MDNCHGTIAALSECMYFLFASLRNYAGDRADSVAYRVGVSFPIIRHIRSVHSTYVKITHFWYAMIYDAKKRMLMPLIERKYSIVEEIFAMNRVVLHTQ